MKKQIAAGLAALCLVGLAGCSAPESTVSDTAEAASPAAESAAESTAAAETPEPQAAEVTLAETVIYDADGVRITATGLDTDGLMGPELALRIENGTAQNLVVQPAWCTVNGYMMSDLFSADVAAGKTANESFYFPSASLARCGVDTVAEIALQLKIIDSGTYQTLTTTDPVTLQTSAAGSYTQTYDDSGEEIYNANGVRVVAQQMTEDLFGQNLGFYVENTSDRAVVVESEDLSVNGYMVSNFFYADVVPGARAVEPLTLLNSELEDNGIETVDTVEFSLKLVDPDSFSTIDQTDPITLQPGA